MNKFLFDVIIDLSCENKSIKNSFIFADTTINTTLHLLLIIKILTQMRKQSLVTVLSKLLIQIKNS